MLWPAWSGTPPGERITWPKDYRPFRYNSPGGQLADKLSGPMVYRILKINAGGPYLNRYGLCYAVVFDIDVAGYPGLVGCLKDSVCIDGTDGWITVPSKQAVLAGNGSIPVFGRYIYIKGMSDL